MTIIEQQVMDALRTAAWEYTKSKNRIDWEQRRYEIAKDVCAATQSASMAREYPESAAKLAVKLADLLIAELKKKHEEGATSTSAEETDAE